MRRVPEDAQRTNNRITSKDWRLVTCPEKVFPEGKRPEFRGRLRRRRNPWNKRIVRKE